MARRETSSSPPGEDASPLLLSRPHRGAMLLNGLITTAFLARFFLPTEATAQGETLWIVGIVFLAALVNSFLSVQGSLTTLQMRQNAEPCAQSHDAEIATPRNHRKFSWLDFSVLMLVGCQLLSSAKILLTEGDKRAAMNVGWEWFGIAITWYLLRERSKDASFRKNLRQALIISGAVLAGVGLWQHYVWQPRIAAEYGALFDRLHSADATEAQTIKQKLASENIPTDGPSLTLYEKRLRDSREPLGRFALANTFGGFLAVCLILAVGTSLSMWHARGPRWEVALWIVIDLLLAWTLLLTKSRTAWIGTLAGGLLLILPLLRLRSEKQRRLITRSLAFVAVLVGIVFLIVAAGGLDQQVLSEAPKSLVYRIQYWTATSRMIAAHPWLGVGPGNFRQEYLVFKLPEASEEISDPHNLFFDVASTGGIGSLFGLVLLLGWTGWHQLKSGLATNSVEAISAAASQSKPQSKIRGIRDNDSPALNRIWKALIGGSGPFLAFLAPFLMRGEWGESGDQLLLLTISCSILFAFWPESTARRDLHFADEPNGSRGLPNEWICFAALTSLAVHLLGAGGISMPAITQLMLLLIVWSRSPIPLADESSEKSLPLLNPGNAQPNSSRSLELSPFQAVHSNSYVISSAQCLFFVIGIVGLVMTAILPVERSRFWILQGDHLYLTGETDRETIEQLYLNATQSDSLSAEPWRRRADFAFQKVASESFRSNESFDLAVRWLGEATKRDPRSFFGPRTLGQAWMSRWKSSQNVSDAQRAAESFQNACQRYPTNAVLMTELAEAYHASGNKQRASEMAAMAITQEEINRKWRHVDRYLPTEAINRMKSYLESSR